VGGWARTYRRKFPARCFHGQGTGRSKSNCFTYTNCHSNGEPHADTDRDGDSNSYADSDTETFTDAETGVNAKAASYAATAPVAIYEKETHCSTPTSNREHAKKCTIRFLCKSDL